jgi:hypothetical protein
MKPLPHGWNEQYAVRFLLEQNERLLEEVAFLKGEVARLDAEKQGRRGPKPKLPSGVNAGGGV